MEAYMQKARVAGPSTAGTPTLSTLPVEIQDAIVHRAKRHDLLRLQRVSRHFHDRASRVIWRSLSFLVAGASLRSPVEYPVCMRLVEALRTIAASSHNYGQYVHTFELRVFCEYMLERSDPYVTTKYTPGDDLQRLLSTNIYLLLRKAKQLETFWWRAPIELDQACWQELGRKSTLRVLGAYLNGHETRVPAPTTSAHANYYQQLLLASGAPDLGYRESSVVNDASKSSYRHMANCTNLTRLSIGNLNDLDHLDGIASCLKASCETIKELSVSFSEDLAKKAKKPATPAANAVPPPPPVDWDEGLSEEDEIISPPPPPASTQTQGEIESVKKNKALQEAALSKILSLEPDRADQSVDNALSSTAKTMARKLKTDNKKLADDVHGIIDKLLIPGKQVTSEDLQVLEQLQLRIDQASLQHLTKRAKHSSSKANSKPKSSNKSPWGYGPPGYSLSHPFSASSAGSPYVVPVVSSAGGLPTYAMALPPGSAYPDPYAPSAYTYPTGSASNAAYGINSTHAKPGAHDPSWHHASATAGDILDQLNFDAFVGDGSTSKIPSQQLEHLKNLYKGGSSENKVAVPASTAKSAAEFVNALNAVASVQQALYDAEALSLNIFTDPAHPKKLAKGKAKNTAAGIPSSVQALPPPPLPDMAMGSSSNASSDTKSTKSLEADPAGASASDLAKGGGYDDMDVDMVHPDPSSDESEDEAEQGAEADAESKETVADEGKEKAPAADPMPIPPRSASPAKRSFDGNVEMRNGDNDKSEVSVDLTMKEWIRQKHGLAIGKLELYLIPVKASVLGRGLQLSRLKSITLLSVGGQGPFWQLMSKAHEELPLSLKEIATDDVSGAFLSCVSQLEGLTSLVLRRRSKKATDNTTTKEPATIEEIRRQAVQPHLATLQVLAVQNDNDQSWCLTRAFVGLLCARATELQQFAFQAGSTRYTELLNGSTDHARALPKLTSLVFFGNGPAAPHGQHSSSSLSAAANSTTAPNGDPHDPNHDSFTRDRSMMCRQLSFSWARNRKMAGDTRLRYISVGGAIVEVGAVKLKAQDIPVWLKEDIEAAKLRAAAKGKTNGGGGGGGQEKTLEQWVEEMGFSNLLNRVDCETKTRRINDVRHITVFGKVVRQAKI